MKAKFSDFSKAKEKYLKFIKSQEVAGEPFKDKLGQLNNYYIPISEMIYKNYSKNKRTRIIGLSGGQGTGKSTISNILKIILKEKFNLDTVIFSIDDFYKTLRDRKKMSKTISKLFLTRGVPGTHDTKILFNCLTKLKKKSFSKILIPKFDKSIDDRCKKNKWTKVLKKPDVVIFEGWCVGARAEKNSTLKKAINSLEKKDDLKLIWRRFVNKELKSKYKKLYNQLNCLLFLKANNFSLLQKWRLKQEKKLWLKNKKSSNNKIMSKKDVIKFMQTYQRITQNMFRYAPKYASIIFNLNSNHQIKSVTYKK